MSCKQPQRQQSVAYAVYSVSHAAFVSSLAQILAPGQKGLPTRYPGLQANDSTLEQALALHQRQRMRTGALAPELQRQLISELCIFTRRAVRIRYLAAAAASLTMHAVHLCCTYCTPCSVGRNGHNAVLSLRALRRRHKWSQHQRYRCHHALAQRRR